MRTGVCPRYRFCPGYGNRPPRPCGDLPQERQRPRTDTQTAPHGRGTAVFAALSPASGTGRSARAEIRPRHRAHAARTARPPRTGGGPPLPAAVLTLAAASPPGRGSAPAGRRPHAGRRLPARAGIRPLPGRYSGQSPGYGNRPPRPCGDLPQERQRPRTDTQTAPHGRGAAVFAALSPASGTGRSARAEIRPRHRAHAARTARPPRTGGGPPLPAAVLTLAAASPPGRGSAPAGRRPHAGRRLPARAGIRPLPGRYSGQSPGQPRPAGISQRPGTNGAGRQHLPRRDGGTEQTPGP